MSTDVNLAKKAIYDKLESQVKLVEAKLETLKARASAAKADMEIKLVAELLTKKQEITHKLQELKKSASGDLLEQAKADIGSRIADLEKSVRGIESKLKAH